MTSRGRDAQKKLTPEIYDAESKMSRLLVEKNGISNDADIDQLNTMFGAYGNINRNGIKPDIIPFYNEAYNIREILKAAQNLINISQRGTGGHAMATVGSYLGLSQTPSQQDLVEQMAQVLEAAAENRFIANIANERVYDPYQSPNEGAQDGTQNDYSAITSLQRLWEIWNRLATSQQNKGAHGERRAVASVTDKMANLENAIKYRAKMGQFPGITEAQVLELIEREGAEEAQRRQEELGHTNSSYHHKKSGNSNGQSKQGGRRKRKHKKRRKTRKHKKRRKTRKHKKRKRRKTKRKR